MVKMQAGATSSRAVTWETAKSDFSVKKITEILDMSLHFWQFCGTKTLGLSPTPVQLGVQRSHLPENAEHLATGPHERSQGCGRGAARGLPGLAGPQVWQPRARQHLNTSLFFHSHPPLPRSGNALGTELLSLRSYQGEKKSIPWRAPARGCFAPPCPLWVQALPVLGP